MMKLAEREKPRNTTFAHIKKDWMKKKTKAIKLCLLENLISKENGRKIDIPCSKICADRKEVCILNFSVFNTNFEKDFLLSNIFISVMNARWQLIGAENEWEKFINNNWTMEMFISYFSNSNDGTWLCQQSITSRQPQSLLTNAIEWRYQIIYLLIDNFGVDFQSDMLIIKGKSPFRCPAPSSRYFRFTGPHWTS